MKKDDWKPSNGGPLSEAPEANGSRYVQGGTIPREWGAYRRAVSLFGNIVARYIAGTYRAADIAAKPHRPRVTVQRPYFDVLTSKVVENACSPHVFGLTTKYRKSTSAGFAAALIELSPGLPIGPGGRPVRRRVLYGESMSSSDCLSGRDQLRVAYRIVASPLVAGGLIIAPTRVRPMLALKPGELTRRSEWFVTKSPSVEIAGRSIHYLISFALPRFTDQSLERSRKRMNGVSTSA